MEGLVLRDIDSRRADLNNAVSIASLSNAKDGKAAEKYRKRIANSLDKEEKKITRGDSGTEKHKPTAAMIEKLNKMFGGG